MPHYTHFTVEERETIQELLWKKSSIRTIAKTLGRSPSSVSREINRNMPPQKRRYAPRLAHARALAHRTHRGGKKLEQYPALRAYVRKKLQTEGWSPEQIAGTAKTEVGTSVSYETIYRYVYGQAHRSGYGYVKPDNEDWRPYLARRRKRRMKKGSRKAQKTARQESLPSITDRPAAADERTEAGHWEDDFIIYTATCPVRLRTTNERLSGVVFIAKTTDATMAEANRIAAERLGPLPAACRKTLTRDRGSENLGYVALEKKLAMRCYFAHAYASWERGSNENVNGLIRRFLPKGTDFRTVSAAQLKHIERLLNTRPRKRLGWKTPYEVFYELTGVALGV